MVDLDALPPSTKTIAGAGIVLVVDLLFLPWRSFEIGPVALTWSAVEGRHAALGVVAVVLAAAVVAATLLRTLRPDVDLPEPPLGWDRTLLAVAATTLGLLVLKLASDTDRLGVGAWLGLLLAAAMLVGAALPVLGATADVAE